MTREQWKTLTPQEQQHKVAELCGWLMWDHPDAMKNKQGWVSPHLWYVDPRGYQCMRGDIPDYLNDLNAMHEAEKIIPDMSEHIHGSLSLVVVGYRTGGCQPMGDSCTELVTATAAQRAEAFVLTMEAA